MGHRRDARLNALQTLYLLDTSKMSLDQTLKFGGSKEMPPETKEFYDQLVQGFLSRKDEVDVLIQKYAINWEMGRMALVDRNILRIAVYEILAEVKTPLSVIIDEAIEISKEYSTEDSSKFINGILDKMKQERASVSGS